MTSVQVGKQPPPPTGPMSAVQAKAPVASHGAGSPRMPRPVRQVGATARRKRQVPWVVAGVLLISGSALGFALWADAQSDRETVLIAATDIAAGETIEPLDLREASISLGDGVVAVPSSQLSWAVGQVAQGPIPLGSLLAPQDLGTDFGVPAGRAVVGASLPAGAFPLSKLDVGDPVQLFSAAASRNEDAGERLLGDGEVWAIEPINLGGEPRVFVSLVVDASIAGAAANAEAHDRLIVVLAARAS